MFHSQNRGDCVPTYIFTFCRLMYPLVIQLYLHVIQYNIPALRFYKKNGFISITEFPGNEPIDIDCD